MSKLAGLAWSDLLSSDVLRLCDFGLVPESSLGLFGARPLRALDSAARVISARWKMPNHSLDGVKSRWDHDYEGSHADQARIQEIYTLASELYWQLYGNRCLSNTGTEYGWLSWLQRVYGRPRPRRVLDLGSGNGDLLLDLQRMDLADQYVGIDLSEVAVRVAQEKANRAGSADVTFLQGDLNQVELPPSTYDLIVAQMCIHHVERLEHLFEQVARALVPNGVFAVNDYVGPTRWQYTQMQLILANLLLRLLPRRFKIRHPDGELKRQIKRPTTQQMIDMDPSEAVRSEEIIPTFRRFFTVEHCIDYGGSVSILVLNNIIGNFRADDPESLRWFKRILAVDHWARRLRIVPTINVVLSGRPTST